MSSRCFHRYAVGLTLSLLGFTSLSCRQAHRSDPILVLAASSLTDVVSDIVSRFEQDNPNTDVIVSTAGSSTLAQQILAGAPFSVYISANRHWTDRLSEENKFLERRELAVSNSLVVVQRAEGMQSTLAAKDILVTATRIAMADPSHVPAGKYVQQALECLDIWDSVSPRVVPTLDVRAAMVAVQTGNISTGVVYSTDVFDKSVSVTPIEQQCQPEIVYVAGLSATASEASTIFYDFIDATGQIDLWSKHGFIIRNSQ